MSELEPYPLLSTAEFERQWSPDQAIACYRGELREVKFRQSIKGEFYAFFAVRTPGGLAACFAWPPVWRTVDRSQVIDGAQVTALCKVSDDGKASIVRELTFGRASPSNHSSTPDPL